MMEINAERKKLIEKVAKLLAMAKSTSYSEEAQTAYNLAVELMAKHNIKSLEDVEPFVRQQKESGFNFLAMYDYKLRVQLAELNNVYFVWSAGGSLYWLTGRERDIAAYEYMCGLVLRQRTDAWLKYKSGGGESKFSKFAYGFAMGVYTKVEELLRDIKTKTREKNALVPMSVIDQARDWYREKFGKPTGNSLKTRCDEAGFEAGRNVSLNREVDRSQGAIRRIGR